MCNCCRGSNRHYGSVMTLNPPKNFMRWIVCSLQKEKLRLREIKGPLSLFRLLPWLMPKTRKAFYPQTRQSVSWHWLLRWDPFSSWVEQEGSYVAWLCPGSGCSGSGLWPLGLLFISDNSRVPGPTNSASTKKESRWSHRGLPVVEDPGEQVPAFVPGGTDWCLGSWPPQTTEGCE